MNLNALDASQQQRAIEAMREFLAAPKRSDNRTPEEADRELDNNRRTLIDHELRPLVMSYLDGKTPLAQFKSRIDGLNKRNEFWGFKGIKGQMFFNMVVNAATDLSECDLELKSAILAPTNDAEAIDRIRKFVKYVKRLGDQFVDSGGSAHSKPKISSIPFFLSYFWQLQDRDKWPVFYTNGERTLTSMDLWRPSEDLGENYIAFKHCNEALGALFAKASGKAFHLYDVEHVLWFKGGNPYDQDKSAETEDTVKVQRPAAPVSTTHVQKLPDGYVPPVVAILPQLSLNDPAIGEAARSSGTSTERAFEIHINAAFTILGYKTQLLGQGQGRVPDGIATDFDNLYAIIWDGKVRRDGYSIGTDDRTIREYIKTQSRDLKRHRSLRNIYYAIVSSSFGDDYDDIVRELKMETDVNEVCLIEAEALVAMVDQRLRDPHQISLGPDGMQRLFTNSGILTSAEVLKILT